MRHKEIHAMRVHPSVKFGADWGLSMLTEKLKQRIKFYTSIEAVKSVDKSLLPKEYGGKVPMAKMIGKLKQDKDNIANYLTFKIIRTNFSQTELWKEELKKLQPTLLHNDKMRVKLEMYTIKQREGAISALKQKHCSAGGENASDATAMSGLQGSFRKLEVD